MHNAETNLVCEICANIQSWNYSLFSSLLSSQLSLPHSLAMGEEVSVAQVRWIFDKWTKISVTFELLKPQTLERLRNRLTKEVGASDTQDSELQALHLMLQPVAKASIKEVASAHTEEVVPQARQQMPQQVASRSTKAAVASEDSMVKCTNLAQRLTQ